MFKQEFIDRINAELVRFQRETESLWKDGSEEEQIFLIEVRRKTYHWAKEKAVETAKARNLKRLKEYGDAQVRPAKKLIETKQRNGKGKTKRTKDEKLADTLSNLGLDPSEFVKRLKKND